MSEPKKIIMQFTKSTKNTHVYKNDKDDAAIPSLYIKKSALPDEPPSFVNITIEF